jgi:hypothetical protein
MVLPKSRTGGANQTVFFVVKEGITEKYGASDDAYIARSEQEMNDVIESLKGEIEKMDTKKKPNTFDFIGEVIHE